MPVTVVRVGVVRVVVREHRVPMQMRVRRRGDPLAVRVIVVLVVHVRVVVLHRIVRVPKEAGVNVWRERLRKTRAFRQRTRRSQVFLSVVEATVKQHDALGEAQVQGQRRKIGLTDVGQCSTRAPQGEGRLWSTTFEAQTRDGDQIVVAGDDGGVSIT